MPLFRYEALSPAGKTVRGVVEAESASAARAKLRKDQIFPTDMKPEVASKTAPARLAFTPGGRVPAAEIAAFTGQLGTLLRAGMPLLRALEALTEQTENRTLRTILAQVRDSVSQGTALATAFEAHAPFDGLYVNLVRAGESSGNLDGSLAGLSAMLTARYRLQRKISGAMAYPILMTFVGTGLLLVLLTYVLPQVVHIFEDLGQKLPWPTRLLLWTSDLFRNWWLVLLLGLAGVAGGFSLLLRNPEMQVRFDRWKLRVPIFGLLGRKAAVARIASALGTLLKGGVPLLEALGSGAKVAGNRALERTLQEAQESVRKGGDLASALSRDPLMPRVAVHMIRVGEESGGLQEMLFQVTTLFEDEVQTSVATLTSLLEPLLILVMGFVIGFMVLAILLPIFQLNQASFG